MHLPLAKNTRILMNKKNHQWVRVNKTIKTGSFPDSLKCANVRPVYKKVDPFDKKKYRLVSILPILSKVYEKVIYEQASNYSEPFFNEIFCGFRKAHST